MMPWALSIIGKRSRSAEVDDEALLTFVRGIADELEERFGVEVERASVSGRDVGRDPRPRSNAGHLEDAEP
jgi:hypothetical protein